MIHVKAITNKGERFYQLPTGGLIGQGVRNTKAGNEFNHLVDISNLQYKSSFQEGGVNETVAQMAKIIREHHQELKDLAKTLEKTSKFETCKSVWNFIFPHIQYKRDKQGVEQLCTPARIWQNRNTPNTPTDCDDHSIFIGALLYCLGIPFTIRIAGYDGKPFSHVYIVVDDICIDTVLHQFNCEAIYSSKQDKYMTIETLHGLDGAESSAVGALVNSVVDFEDQFDGLGAMDEESEERAIRKLGKTQLEIALAEYERDPESFHKIGYDAKYWQLARKAYNSYEDGIGGISVHFDKALQEAGDYEDNIINKISDRDDGSEDDSSNIIYESINALEGFGYVDGQARRRVRRKRERDIANGTHTPLEGWFKKLRRKIKKVAKKVGKGVAKVSKKVYNVNRKMLKKTWKINKKILKKTWKVTKKVTKKVGRVLMKLNPVMMLVRTGVRLAVKKNWFGLAYRLGFGLLTPQQAAQIGVEPAALAKAKKGYSRFISKYKNMGGREKVIRKDIAKAWEKAAKRNGDQTIPASQLHGVEGLGVIPAIVGVAVKLAPVVLKFLKPILKFLKKILPIDKIFKKIKKKSVERLESKIAKAITPEDKAKYEKRLKRVKNTLTILEQKDTQKSPLAPTGEPEKRTIPTEEQQSLTSESNTKEAGMSPLLIGALVLVGGGLMFSKKDDKKKLNPKK